MLLSLKSYWPEPLVWAIAGSLPCDENRSVSNGRSRVSESGFNRGFIFELNKCKPRECLHIDPFNRPTWCKMPPYVTHICTVVNVSNVDRTLVYLMVCSLDRGHIDGACGLHNVLLVRSSSKFGLYIEHVVLACDCASSFDWFKRIIFVLTRRPFASNSVMARKKEFIQIKIIPKMRLSPVTLILYNGVWQYISGLVKPMFWTNKWRLNSY